MRSFQLCVLSSCLVLFSGFSASAADGDDWLGADKARHFAACLALSGAGYGAGALLFDAPEARWLTGAGLAMGVGVGKELYDARWGTTGFSAKDLAWDAAGTATGLAVSYLVDRFIIGREPASRAGVSRVVGGGRGRGASRLALDELHQLLAMKAGVDHHHGAAPAVPTGDEHGDLPPGALVHAARGQHPDLLGEASPGKLALEPARQVQASSPGASAQQALAADQHLHLLPGLLRSSAILIPHPSSSSSGPGPGSLAVPRWSDTPLRAL